MKRKSNLEKQQRDRYLKTDFGDLLSKATPVDLDLEFQPPTQAISIRLPTQVLNKIRILADERDVPYQSLIKTWLVEKIKKAA